MIEILEIEIGRQGLRDIPNLLAPPGRRRPSPARARGGPGRCRGGTPC